MSLLCKLGIHKHEKRIVRNKDNYGAVIVEQALHFRYCTRCGMKKYAGEREWNYYGGV